MSKLMEKSKGREMVKEELMLPWQEDPIGLVWWVFASSSVGEPTTAAAVVAAKLAAEESDERSSLMLFW